MGTRIRISKKNKKNIKNIKNINSVAYTTEFFYGMIYYMYIARS